MRWGFHRSFNPAINNARSDKQEGGMWREEMQEWLAGSGRWDFQPFAGLLVVTTCESPLAKRPGAGTRQGELF